MARSPVHGTLTDADVKELIVRTARATSATDLHGIIRRLVTNRLTLVAMIESQNADLRQATASSSQFDVALIEQLKLMQCKLSQVSADRDRLGHQTRDLTTQLRGAGRLIADLKAAVKARVLGAIEDRRMIQFLSKEVMTARHEQSKAIAATTPKPTTNVVAISRRDQMRQRDSSIAAAPRPGV